SLRAYVSSQPRLGWSPTPKRRVNRGTNVIRFDIAENGKDAIVRPRELLVKCLQISDLNTLHTAFRSEHIQAVAGIAKESAAHRARSALQKLIFLSTDSSELNFTLAFERR